MQPVQGARSLSPKNSSANLRKDSQAAANNFVTSLTVGINVRAADTFADSFIYSLLRWESIKDYCSGPEQFWVGVEDTVRFKVGQEADMIKVRSLGN